MAGKTQSDRQKPAGKRKSPEEIAREDARMIEEARARPGIRELISVREGWQGYVENPESAPRSGKKTRAS